MDPGHACEEHRESCSRTKENRLERRECNGESADAEMPGTSVRETLRYVRDFKFSCCDDAEKYEIILKIGQGSFGEVFKARDRMNPQKLVAMKRIIIHKEGEGISMATLREIRILQNYKHQNIVNLIEVCVSLSNARNLFRSTVFMVFDFCEHDLAGLLKCRRVVFTLGQKKYVMEQLFNALFFIHTRKILHRDIKTANVLITKNGILKLADFSLARSYTPLKDRDPRERYTNQVVTLWYRPPELLLGDRNYGPSVDMWGAGCLMAEMWTRCPILPGSSEKHQLSLITELCGNINPQVWPGVEDLELYRSIRMVPTDQRQHEITREKLMHCVDDTGARNLLDNLLVLDPSKRIDSHKALDHNFFWTDPMPQDLCAMLAQHRMSMFSYHPAPRRVAQRPRSFTHHDSQYQDRIY